MQVTGRGLTFNADYRLGKEGERNMLPKMMSFFNDATIHQLDRFSPNDFVSDSGTSYEMKTRRNPRNKYPTTYFPVNKAIEGVTEQYFVFRFSDGIDSYIRYDPVRFSKYRTEMLVDGRPGMNNYKKLHWHIPIEHLTDF